MRGCAQIVGKIGMGIDCLKRSRGSAIAVFADQTVDGLVFAKFLYSRGEYDQLRIVSQRHACAVDGLVAQPGGMKLAWIEIDHGFLDGFIHNLEVDLETQFRGQIEALDVIADIQASNSQPTVSPASHNSLHINDGQVGQEMFGGVVKNAADGIVGAAEDTFHSVDGAQIVAAVDSIAATRSEEHTSE